MRALSTSHARNGDDGQDALDHMKIITCETLLITLAVQCFNECCLSRNLPCVLVVQRRHREPFNTPSTDHVLVASAIRL